MLQKVSNGCQTASQILILPKLEIITFSNLGAEILWAPI
jgi:hypothetical protein